VGFKEIAQMLIRRLAVSSVLKAALNIVMLTAAVSAFAQSEPGQWAGELYIVDSGFPDTSKNFIDEKDTIHLSIPNLARVPDFTIPKRYLNWATYSYWRHDALYTLATGRDKNEDGTQVNRWIFAKWQDGEWNFLGDYNTDTGELLKAIPCGDDKFIVISNQKDLTGNNGTDRTPFVRMSVLPGKTELRVNSSIDHGQDDFQKYMSEPNCFSLAWYSNVIMTDEYATLINYKTGLYWVFSLEKLTLVKAGSIFKKVTPEMAAKGGFPQAILCANPEKNGTILISSLEEYFFMAEKGDAFKELRELREKNPFISNEEAKKILDLRVKELAYENPFIAWYRLYPENGKVEMIAPPEGGANIREELKNDVWRPMPDGSVKMAWDESKLKEIKKTDQKEDSEREAKKDTNTKSRSIDIER
jgi:hypothetical protein